MKLERDDKLEATSDDLWMDVAMIILENRSDMCVGAFGISPPLAMCPYERWY